METIAQHRTHGGTIGYYSHASEACAGDMRFSVFVPPQANDGPVPVVTWLSGLTCTEDNFTTKSGAYGVAAELGLMVVAPDTSPRGENVPDDGAYDLGQGAGFYLDATEAPWSTHFNMYSYITRDLPAVLQDNFAGDWTRQGIMGHSMGGHGALTIWLKNPDTFTSASAVAPICAPMQCPWGDKALTAYLGVDRAAWAQYDTTELMKTSGDGSARASILVDQGLADNFLDGQLHPHLLEAACAEVGQKITVNRREGYDHSYFFIASVIGDHLRHHATELAEN
ncbi:MAG: S-formylglutathione hydrolase [Paracoccaceae bacterium]|jgi:S-formylglutathione hydrolase